MLAPLHFQHVYDRRHHDGINGRHSNFKFNEISIPVFSLVERGPAWICKASVLNFDSLEPFFMAYDLAVFSLAIGRMTKILYILSVSRNFIVENNCFSNYLLSPEIIICICKRISVLLYTYYLVCFWIEKEKNSIIREPRVKHTSFWQSHEYMHSNLGAWPFEKLGITRMNGGQIGRKSGTCLQLLHSQNRGLNFRGQTF